MSTALTTLTTKLAATLNMGDGIGLIETLKATAFRGQVSDAQMTALMVVANQYGLNPWTKEIYAFPDKNNGIVPVVGVDGWTRIINSHPQFDGEEFEYGPTLTVKNKQVHEWIDCIIYRKDRSRPTRVREFFSEVYRESAQPWNSHPNRMHRHKSLIQCARLAFGFGGIYDPDEAARIAEEMGTSTVIDGTTGEVIQKATPAPLPPYPADRFAENLPAWHKVISEGRKTADQLIAFIESKNTMTEEQKTAIRTQPAAASTPAPEISAPAIKARMDAAQDLEQLDEAASLIPNLPGLADQKALNTHYMARQDELTQE